MFSENVGSVPRTGSAPVLYTRTEWKSICELQDDGLARFENRKADGPQFIFSFLDGEIYGWVYALSQVNKT